MTPATFNKVSLPFSTARHVQHVPATADSWDDLGPLPQTCRVGISTLTGFPGNLLYAKIETAPIVNVTPILQYPGDPDSKLSQHLSLGPSASSVTVNHHYFLPWADLCF